MSVFRSLKHVGVQLIDDTASKTLLAVSDLHLPKADLPAVASAKAGAKKDRSGLHRAKGVGALAAERARGQGITTVVFDRGRYAYVGQVKALAEGAREGGLKF